MRTQALLISFIAFVSGLVGWSHQLDGRSEIQTSPQGMNPIMRKLEPPPLGASLASSLLSPISGHPGQQHVSQQHVNHVSSLPVAVDGLKTPENIPDRIAYRHFVQVNALTADASMMQVARRDAFLARVKLSEKDRASLLEALAGVREQLDAIDSQRESLAVGAENAGAMFAALKSQQDEILDTARVNALASLTAAGRALLEDHIQGWMKRRIKIYGQVR